MTGHLDHTRAAYDAIAADYDEMTKGEPEATPLSLPMLTAFAEVVRGRVLEVGSGPGRVTAYLCARGVDAYGIDLSPAMVALARNAHPGLRFDEGSMTELPVPDGTLGGVVAWYSIIHLPDESLPAVFAEFRRVLAPDGQLLLAFQVGTQARHIAEAFGHPIALDFRRLSPDRIAELLADAGFAVRARTVREAEENETAPQAYLLARRSH